MNFQSIQPMRRFSAERYQKVNLFETDRTAMDIYCLQPGQSQRLHSHAETDKYYLIWEGRATVQVGSEVRELGPGEAALARPGVEHSISNQGEGAVVALVFQAPKSF